jgi:hypothetical protein
MPCAGNHNIETIAGSFRRLLRHGAKGSKGQWRESSPLHKFASRNGSHELFSLSEQMLTIRWANATPELDRGQTKFAVTKWALALAKSRDNR